MTVYEDYEETEVQGTLLTALGNCYPNPGSGMFSIPYSVGEATSIEIFITDVMGRKVTAVVAEGEHHTGNYTAEFDASALVPGIYYYSLRSPDTEGVQTKRLVLVK